MSFFSKRMAWVGVVATCGILLAFTTRSLTHHLVSAQPSAPACIRHAVAEFSSEGFRPEVHGGIFRRWRALLCHGINLGPATAPVFHSGRAGSITQSFIATGQRITWNRHGHQTTVGTIGSVAEEVFSSHGIQPQPSLPITPSWVSQYHAGHNWVPALEPLNRGYGSRLWLRQVFNKGTATYANAKVTWAPDPAGTKHPWLVNTAQWRPIGIAVGTFSRDLVHQNAVGAGTLLAKRLRKRAATGCVQQIVGFSGWPQRFTYTIRTWNGRMATVQTQFVTQNGTENDTFVLADRAKKWVIQSVVRSNTGPITCPPWSPPTNAYPNTFSVGDSVMVDGQPYLEQMGITVDAAVSRQFDTGVQILRDKEAAGTLPARVVVGLGTNGPMTQSDFDAMMKMLSGKARVVVLTVKEPRWWQNQVNAVIRAGVRKTKNGRIADWFAVSNGHPEWFAGDGIHPNSEGSLAYAHVIANALGGP